MYQVIKMFGDWEPRWFIEGWQDDIILEKRLKTGKKLSLIIKKSG